jgi:hypothetical protein
MSTAKRLQWADEDLTEPNMERAPWCLLVQTDDPDDPDIVGPFATYEEAKSWAENYYALGGVDIRAMCTPEAELAWWRAKEENRREKKAFLRRYFPDQVRNGGDA